MTSTFKFFPPTDITSVRSVLYEAVPITGTIVSGTYSDLNIKNYAGTGMFQSVYDYPFLSSSANHIFDLTVGYSADSSLSGGASTHSQNQKKINIYNQMAQVLVGFDSTGSVRKFDRDGNLASGDKLSEVLFVNFARLLNKDEIKKQSFSISFFTGSTVTGSENSGVRAPAMLIQDHGATTNYKVNSPAGEYGVLYTSSAAVAGNGVGLIYYQAGVVVLTASIFDDGKSGYFGTPALSQSSIDAALTGSSISGACDGIRNRLINISFNNTTEINSTIYFCEAHAQEYNYSSNPTYLTGSKIRVKESEIENPLSFITSVGLYSADKELLAVAKLSEPIKKSPTDRINFKVRLDY